MKLFLDDERETPPGWTRVYTVAEAIAQLQTRAVTHLSCDNDLGSLDSTQEGYRVLDWLEETVFHDRTFPVPEITVHSSNASRVEYMQRAVRSIQRFKE